MAVLCPECDSPLDVEDNLDEGETLQCEECGAELGIVSTDPIELSVIDEEGYDDEELSPIKTDDEE